MSMPINRANYAGGVEVAIDDEGFISKVLDVSSTIEEAIRRSKIEDIKVLNDITKLFDYLKEFKIVHGLETLKFWLDGQLSIGGYNFALSIQGHSKIPVPSAMGVKLSKEEARNIKEITMARERRHAVENEEQND